MSRSEGPSRSTTVETPLKGALEELDGTPIRPPAAVGTTPAVPWRRATVAAAALAAGRPRLWAHALVAFLARGGLVVLALPIVVLPTFIGIANVVGPASVSAAGPGSRLVAMIVAGCAAVAALVVAGILVAAAAETALHRATVAPDADEPAGRGGSVPSFMVREPRGEARRATVRVAVLRLLLLVPVAAVTALAVPAWVAVAYRELTLPGDVAVPLVLRVLAGAPAASIGVLVTWLAAEMAGGFATRRAVLFGTGVPRALAEGIVDPLRAPVGTALTVVVALGLSAAVLVPAVWAVAAAWNAARRVLTGEIDAAAALLVALALAATWTVALMLAGIAAAGRATFMTAELLRRAPAGQTVGEPSPTAAAGPARHAAAGPRVG